MIMNALEKEKKDKLISIREKLFLKQVDFAELLGIQLRTYRAYESFHDGNGRNVPNNVLALAQSEFNKVHKETQNVLKEDAAPYSSANNNNTMYVPIVSQYAYAGYLNGFSNEAYIENLPKYPVIVDKEYKGVYRIFEVKGDSMTDGTDKSIHENSKILCRQLQRHLWERSKLHINDYIFLIVTNEGIVLKQIKEHNVDTGVLTLHSFNDYYEDYTINVDDVILIFNVVQVFSKPVF